MVGRADELAEFVDAWGQASGGDGARTVVITGAAGIGKSLLAARTLARLSGGPGAIRQHLGPLDVHEVGEVLGQVYPAPVPGRRRVDRAGERGARLPGRRDVQQAGGQTAGHFHPDGYRARVEPAPQDQVGVAYRGGAVGGTAPPAARQLTTVGPCRPPPKPWSDTSSPPASPAR